MRNGRLRIAAAGLTACLALASGGCSLLNPYVRAPELDAGDAGAAGLPASDRPHNRALLAAVKVAAAQRKAYYDAVSDRAKLRNGMPLLLVPLGAAALYKGLSSPGGESTRRILLQEGLVGASIYGVGSYYTSSAREQTYLAGAKALSCSLYAATPFFLPDELAERLGAAKLDALSVQVAKVRGLKDRVRAAADALGTDAGTRVTLGALADRATSSIDAATELLRRAAETQAALDDVGARLRAMVETVVVEVAVQIARTEPDPSAVLTIVAGLPATAKKFASGGTFAAASPEAAQAPGGAVTSAGVPATELAAAVNDLDPQAATVRFALDTLAQRVRAVPALDTCRVQLAQGSIDITPDDGVEMGVGQTRQFVIRSSAGIPSVEWVGAIHPRVDWTKSLAGESMVVQVIYKEAVDGISQVTFQAATRELKKQVAIALAPATTPKTNSAAGGNANVGATTPDPSAAKPADGAPAASTTPAAATTPGAAGTAAIPATPAASTPPVTAPIVGARNVFEASLSVGRVKALQARLDGVPQTGVFDQRTRDAIIKWQLANNQSPPNGELQREAALAAIMK